MKTNKQAFTLLEVIVTIVIMTILLALILPALQNAKNTARKVSCAASLRSLGDLVVVYATDNNNYLPIYDIGNIRPNRYDLPSPIGKLVHYYGNNNKKILYCNDRHDSQFVFGGAFSGYQVAYSRYYIGNYAKYQQPFASILYEGSLNRKINYEFTYLTPLMFDSLYYPESSGNIVPLHGLKGLNILYGDMHVDWYLGKQYYYGNTNTPLFLK